MNFLPLLVSVDFHKLRKTWNMTRNVLHKNIYCSYIHLPYTHKAHKSEVQLKLEVLT